MKRRSRHEAVVMTRRAAFAQASSHLAQTAGVVVHSCRTLDRIADARSQLSPGAGPTQAAVLAATLELAQRLGAARAHAADTLERAKRGQLEAAQARAASRKALDGALDARRVAASLEARKRDARAVPVKGSSRP